MKVKKNTTGATKAKTKNAKIVFHANGHKFGASRPGVLATLVELLVNAGRKKQPMTKDAILDELEKRFADRGRDKMNATVSMQLGGGLKIEKNIIVNKSDSEAGRVYMIVMSEQPNNHKIARQLEGAQAK